MQPMPPPPPYGTQGPPPPPPYAQGAPAPPYYQPPYPSAQYAQAPTDAKATMSLVLGVVSIMASFCYGFGILFGIPALILGVVSRKQIARSEGALGGGGVALAGAITGGIGGGISLLYVAVIAVFIGVAAMEARKTPTYTPPTTPPAATSPASAATVVDLHASAGPLRVQLAAEWARASAAHAKLMVMTTATWSKDATDISAALLDDEVQDALEDVVVVRIDVDEFKPELRSSKLEKPDVPWFFLIGPTFEPTDAISANEWGANTPSSIAPVMRKFVLGTLKARRVPAPKGTSM
jgi:hypothetical protein